MHLLKIIFSIYGLSMFVAFFLLIFPLIVMASFWGDVKGGNFIYRLCKIWADTMFPLWGIHHANIFEAPHDYNRQYVFVFNHCSYMDIPLIMKSIRKQHFRVLGKSEMAKIPLFGFMYKKAAVMVDRSNPEKRANSLHLLKASIQKGISVVIAPEGTFNMGNQPLKSFYDGAFKVAIETQTPIKPMLFLDAYDRLNHTPFLSLTPGKSRTIHLKEIPVEGLTLEDVPALKEKVYAIMEEKLIHYKASWIKS